MVSIRKYEEKDRADVHFVCHNSEGPEEVPEFLTGQFYHNTFCNYYIDHEPSRRPSGLRKTNQMINSLAHRTTWLRSDLP